MNHAKYMNRCLELAKLGRRKVGNGAMVGAVLVRDEKVLAEAYHRGFAQPHAERDLLSKYEQKISSEDILYVNLEPCRHHGKTSPCTDIILDRGVKHVVVGMSDPDRRVRGKGIEILRLKGVHVTGPILLSQCERFNRGFVSVRTCGRPWITLKHAQTKQGAIAEQDGRPLQITSEDQDHYSHQFLRGQSDAILVGVETIIRDNPRLTIRHTESAGQPSRIILDPHGRIPDHANVLTDEYKDNTMIVTDKDKYSDQTFIQKSGLSAKNFSENNVRYISMEKGKFNWQELWDALITPTENFPGITSVLVEGGPRTWKTFQEDGMVDEEVTLIGR